MLQVFILALQNLPLLG